jgi:hypothetical protein
MCLLRSDIGGVVPLTGIGSRQLGAIATLVTSFLFGVHDPAESSCGSSSVFRDVVARGDGSAYSFVVGIIM